MPDPFRASSVMSGKRVVAMLADQAAARARGSRRPRRVDRGQAGRRQQSRRQPHEALGGVRQFVDRGAGEEEVDQGFLGAGLRDAAQPLGDVRGGFAGLDVDPEDSPRARQQCLSSD
jgi:hypothetical protein